ncbi:hypothetical protein FCI23_27695 [Actinacidiphila oryziradicis]|uniref:Uncharacterized protein n=1 Tax=Actinacidiphila oryziradicis TaxID=2571141 RepID=A0A4U0SFX3_9ACTN|nr:hypothetical protein FCI23_27695 [Actinacidiphila oryziradicis]
MPPSPTEKVSCDGPRQDRPHPPGHTRHLQPDELNARGLWITCLRCRACRDWLLLNVRHQVIVRLHSLQMALIS